MLACMKGNLGVVEMLLGLEGIQPDLIDGEGRNIVHYAIENEDEEQGIILVQSLLQRYEYLKDWGSSKIGYTGYAIRKNRVGILKTLVKNGLNIKNEDNSELSLLHEAVKQFKVHGSIQIVKNMIHILLDAGLSAMSLNHKNQTYITFARNEGILNQLQIQQLTPQTTTNIQCKINSSSNISSDIINKQQEQPQYQPNHKQISEQMYNMAVQNSNLHNLTWNIICPFYLKLVEIVDQLYGSIEVIGSFACNLWLPSSDIDFLLIIPDSGNLQLFQEITETIFNKVKKIGSHNYVKMLKTYKLPMIKLILNEQYHGIEVELFISDKKNIASRYVTFINEVMTYYPQIQIIYIVVRKLLSERDLHDHKKGGLKAYALFLLIYSMRTLYHYQYVSQFVQHFSYYYGMAYQYACQLSYEGDVEYKINITDPLNSDNNMGGKKTNILLLKQLFLKVYYGLNIDNDGSKMKYLVDLIRQL